MIWIDYAIILIIGCSALISLMRGFVKEALSLVTWSGAFFIASHFHKDLEVYLTTFDNDNYVIKSSSGSISIIILFIVALISGGLINYIIGLLINRTGLSGIDRILGIGFGVLRGILIVLALLFVLEVFTPLPQSKDWQCSELISQLSKIIKYK